MRMAFIFLYVQHDNLSLRAPAGLDLGFCATHQTTSLVFTLENTGEIEAPYRWDVPEPFRLVPRQGVVAVGKSHEITVSIILQDASETMCCYSRDRYAFRTPGNCNTILNLRGMSIPPRVMLYKDLPPSKAN